LDRTEQAVYAMLGDYSKKQKAKKNRGTHNSTGHQEFADEDVQRMQTGCNAAVRHFEAADAGDEAKAEEAKREFLEIAKAESLKSVIFGDKPSYKLLLVQLLGMIEQVGDKVPMMLITHSRAIRKRIGIDDVSFGLETADRKPPHSAQGTKEVSNDSFGDFLIPMEKPEQAQTAQAGW